MRWRAAVGKSDRNTENNLFGELIVVGKLAKWQLQVSEKNSIYGERRRKERIKG